MEIKTEKQIDNSIHEAFNRGGTRLFKNVNGNFWQGKMLEFKDGIVRLMNPRRVQAGVGGVGGSDRIGYHQIIITPEMVGKKVAVFCAIELKTSVGTATPEQLQFIKVTLDMGGIAGIAREKKDIANLFDRFIARLQS